MTAPLNTQLLDVALAEKHKYREQERQQVLQPNALPLLKRDIDRFLQQLQTTQS